MSKGEVPKVPAMRVSASHNSSGSPFIVMLIAMVCRPRIPIAPPAGGRMLLVLRKATVWYRTSHVHCFLPMQQQKTGPKRKRLHSLFTAIMNARSHSLLQYHGRPSWWEFWTRSSSMCSGGPWSTGLNSYTGEVGGEGVGGLLDDDDLSRFCGEGFTSGPLAEDEAACAVADDVAPEEITGAKIQVSRGGSSSLLSAKWMRSAEYWPLRLFITLKVMSFVYFSLASCCLNRFPRRREAAAPRLADSCCRTSSSVAYNLRSRRCSLSCSAFATSDKLSTSLTRKRQQRMKSKN